VADVEIVARVERLRRWTVEEKAELIAEVEAEGGKVRLVARRHRISENLLYNGRSGWKAVARAVIGSSEAAVRHPQRYRHPDRRDRTSVSKAGGSDRDRLAERCPRQRRCLRQ
jgi:transposase-like protein